MRPLSEATSRITGKSFSRKYIALGRIVNSWFDIVGADLAYKVQPVKINYRKKDRQENPDAVLEIAVSSADATLLYYQKDLILERINRIFGERWITGLKFVHIAANTSQAPPPKAKTPLTLSQKNTLSSMLNRVSDPEMREKLEKLGQEVILENIT